jgi:pilus biogenesis lipoprotein CpaD
MTAVEPMPAAPYRAARLAGRALRAIGIAGVALILAACGTTTTPYGIYLGDYQAAPRDLIAVERIGNSHAVRLADRTGMVSKAERNRLAAFIAHISGQRPDSLRVVLRGRATPAQVRTVTNLLVADGVHPRHIARADWHSGTAVPPGTIVVDAGRAIAVLPNCPGWINHVSAPQDNWTSPNLGCADVFNFAAMVADPHHLSEGASSIYHDGERAVANVTAYRTDQVKELPRIDPTFTVR